MRRGNSTSPALETTLLLAAGVLLVVIMALLLAQADSYQLRSAIPSNNLPIIDPEATAAAGEIVVVYLPSEVSPTPTLPAAPTQSPPMIDHIAPDLITREIESTCGEAGDDWLPYIVETADTLGSLALQFDLSINDIVQANCLSRERIIPGQQLFLPEIVTGKQLESECEPPPNWIQVLVGSRDTLTRLARAHGTTVYHLMEANCLQNAELSAGRRIFLPLMPPDDANPNDGHPQTPASSDAPSRPEFPISPLATATSSLLP